MAVDTTEAAAAAEAARQAMGGIGVSLARKEDARFIHGQGHYVDDVVLPGMLHMVDRAQPTCPRADQGHRHQRGHGHPGRGRGRHRRVAGTAQARLDAHALG